VLEGEMDNAIAIARRFVKAAADASDRASPTTV